MIGLVVLAILVLYVIFVFNLASYFVRLAGFGGRPVIIWGVMTILLVLPFADEIVGRVQFDQACKKVAGYSVTDTIRSAQLAKYGDWPPPHGTACGMDSHHEKNRAGLQCAGRCGAYEARLFVDARWMGDARRSESRQLFFMQQCEHGSNYGAARFRVD